MEADVEGIIFSLQKIIFSWICEECNFVHDATDEIGRRKERAKAVEVLLLTKRGKQTE